VQTDQIRWNHNIHYYPLIRRAVPAGCERALEVGCGEGILARELSALVPQVQAIDLDEPSIALARQHGGAGIEYICGDVLTHDFEPASFGFITCVAALHHMDAAAGLSRMRQLLQPGGRLVVIGCGRTAWPADLPFELAGAVAHQARRAARRPYWEHCAPVVWPPPETYSGMRRIGRRALPGASYRRHLYWRYSLTWTKPATGQ
jgi:SAM-dependent methyltransferase